MFDASFLLKQFLPPGLTVERLQAEAVALGQQVVAAVQQVREVHALALENNRMLRQIIDLRQQQSFNNTSENNTHALATAQQDAVSAPAHELGHGTQLGTVASAGTDAGTDTSAGSSGSVDYGRDSGQR